jgi:type III secretory pathway component EscR
VVAFNSTEGVRCWIRNEKKIYEFKYIYIYLFKIDFISIEILQKSYEYERNEYFEYIDINIFKRKVLEIIEKYDIYDKEYIKEKQKDFFQKLEELIKNFFQNLF